MSSVKSVEVVLSEPVKRDYGARGAVDAPFADLNKTAIRPERRGRRQVYECAARKLWSLSRELSTTDNAPIEAFNTASALQRADRNLVARPDRRRRNSHGGALRRPSRRLTRCGVHA